MMRAFYKKMFFFLLPVIIAGSGMEILIRNIPNNYQVKKYYLDRYADMINHTIKDLGFMKE